MSDDIEKRQYRLEDATTKLTNVIMNVNGLISVHDQRLITLENKDKEFKEELTSVKKDLNKEVSDLYTVMSNNVTSINNKIDKESDSNINYIDSRLNIINNELDELSKIINDKTTSNANTISNKINSIESLMRQNCSNMNTRIDKIERYLWMTIGGGLVLSWLFSNMDKVSKIIN